MIEKITSLQCRLKCKDLNIDYCFLIYQYSTCFFYRLPSVLKLLTVAATNVSSPFVYVSDVVKDSLQLAMLVIAAGGPGIVLRYWYSWTTFVSG